MRLFPSSIFLSLATFAALMCFSGPSVALEYEHGPPVSAYQMTDVGTIIDDFMNASVAILASDQVAIREQLISQHVAGLVSVSPSQKVAMYIRRVEEHHEELERREHRWSLARMLRGD
tara:strand:- start:921 stop:1274 length:354 start_codon:yes stop_codon:yes gene_type:complete